MKRNHVRLKEFYLGLPQLFPILTISIGAFKERVIDIRNVLDKSDFFALSSEVTVNEIKGQVRSSVTEMGCVVGSNAADIHSNRVMVRERTSANGGGQL